MEQNYVTVTLCYYYYYFFKLTGRKTRLDTQNYAYNGDLLSYHGVVERNRISSLQSVIIIMLLYWRNK